MNSNFIQIKPSKLVNLKDDLIRMRSEILGSPSKIQRTTPWKVQPVS